MHIIRKYLENTVRIDQASENEVLKGLFVQIGGCLTEITHCNWEESKIRSITNMKDDKEDPKTNSNHLLFHIYEFSKNR